MELSRSSVTDRVFVDHYHSTADPSLYSSTFKSPLDTDVALITIHDAHNDCSERIVKGRTFSNSSPSANLQSLTDEDCSSQSASAMLPANIFSLTDSEDQEEVGASMDNPLLSTTTSVSLSVLRMSPTLTQTSSALAGQGLVLSPPSDANDVNMGQLLPRPHGALFLARLRPPAEYYTCRWSDCKQSMPSLDSLVNHVNDVHIKVYGQDTDYKCHWEGCPRQGKGFNARYKMLIHVRTHTNEKPHKCSECGKSFSRLENLKIHTRSHTGEKPYLCPVEGCHKAYSNSSDRFKHVRTHQEEKPYHCKTPGCLKRYTDPSSLRKHIKTNGHQFRSGQVSARSHSTVISKPIPLMPVLSPNNNTSLVSSPSQVMSQLINHDAIVPVTNHIMGMLQHGSMIPLSSLASNPLLSAASNHGNMSSTSTQTDLHIDCADRGSPKRTLSPDLSVMDDAKCQDTPLDLTTSPILSQTNIKDEDPSHMLQAYVSNSID